MAHVEMINMMIYDVIWGCVETRAPAPETNTPVPMLFFSTAREWRPRLNRDDHGHGA